MRPATIKIVQSAGDMRALSGDNVVLAAIEPSLTPLFPVSAPATMSDT